MSAQSSKQLLTCMVPKEAPPTPEGIKKYRYTSNAEPGRRLCHAGLVDQKLPEAGHRYGRKCDKGETTQEVMKSDLPTALHEHMISGHRLEKEPLGRPVPLTYELPAKFKKKEHVFGKASIAKNEVREIAGDLICPPNPIIEPEQPKKPDVADMPMLQTIAPKKPFGEESVDLTSVQHCIEQDPLPSFFRRCRVNDGVTPNEPVKLKGRAADDWGTKECIQGGLVANEDPPESERLPAEHLPPVEFVYGCPSVKMLATVTDKVGKAEEVTGSVLMQPGTSQSTTKAWTSDRPIEELKDIFVDSVVNEATFNMLCEKAVKPLSITNICAAMKL